MKLAAFPVLLGCATAAAILPALGQGAAPSTSPVLVPHRAVYDLKLADNRSSRPMQSVRGRILYDFSGSACEGYALTFRQVSELDSGEGKVAISDLRSIVMSRSPSIARCDEQFAQRGVTI